MRSTVRPSCSRSSAARAAVRVAVARRIVGQRLDEGGEKPLHGVAPVGQNGGCGPRAWQSRRLSGRRCGELLDEGGEGTGARIDVHRRRRVGRGGGLRPSRPRTNSVAIGGTPRTPSNHARRRWPGRTAAQHAALDRRGQALGQCMTPGAPVRRRRCRPTSRRRAPQRSLRSPAGMGATAVRRRSSDGPQRVEGEATRPGTSLTAPFSVSATPTVATRSGSARPRLPPPGSSRPPRRARRGASASAPVPACPASP